MNVTRQLEYQFAGSHPVVSGEHSRLGVTGDEQCKKRGQDAVWIAGPKTQKPAKAG